MRLRCKKNCEEGAQALGGRPRNRTMHYVNLHINADGDVDGACLDSVHARARVIRVDGHASEA